MVRLRLSLGVKLVICLLGSMIVIFSALGYQSVRLHRRHLEDMTVASADRISDTIKSSTRYSMLQNHRDEVYHIISTIGTEPGIKKIRIFNKQGEISYSTDEREVSTLVDKRAEACYACHAQEQPLTRLNRPDRMRIYTTPEGERVLGLINPIDNEPGCYGAPCHAHPPDHQVLGVLDVALSLAHVDETIAEGQRAMLGNFAAAMVLISLIVGVLVLRMAYRPIQKLIAGTQRVAAGDLEKEIEVGSQDELGELAASFNRMTGRLRSAHQELTDWARTLESRVEQKTGELRRAHEHMIQVERMASLGKLAAVVAHEINNPLTGILTYAKLLLRKLGAGGFDPPEREHARQYLETIGSESARCGDIVKNLLQFARHGQIHLQRNDVNAVVRESVRLVQHKIQLSGVTTRLALDEALPPIVCDAQQLKQALIALSINACEAMSGGGVLEIGTRRAAQEPGVEIVVRDNGSGMSAETQQHLFEPFYTTKEQGKGVGLGLSVVYGIVRQHGGEITFQSALGQGSTFVISLREQPPAEPETAGDDHDGKAADEHPDRR